MTVTAPARLLTTKEAADIIGVCTRSMERWEKQGRIKAVRPSPQIVRYDPRDVEAFIQSLRAEAK